MPGRILATAQRWDSSAARESVPLGASVDSGGRVGWDSVSCRDMYGKERAERKRSRRCYSRGLFLLAKEDSRKYE